jgi:hypothetical protein
VGAVVTMRMQFGNGSPYERIAKNKRIVHYIYEYSFYRLGSDAVRLIVVVVSKRQHNVW